MLRALPTKIPITTRLSSCCNFQFRSLHRSIVNYSTMSSDFTMDPTFTLKQDGLAIPVVLPSNITQDQLTSFTPFNTWFSTLTSSLTKQSEPNHPFRSSPYELQKIVVQSVDWFGSRVGFIKLQAQVQNSKNEWLPGAVFLRGPSVAILVRLLLYLLCLTNEQ
jgi:hypothetical protein